MPKNRVVILGCLALAIVGALAWAIARQRQPEPVSGGKTLSTWLDDLAANKQEGCRDAIASIGVEAVPFILRKLDRDDSPVLNKYRALWPTLPGFVKKHLSEPKSLQFTAANAATALQWCGPKAVPLLEKRLKDPNPAVREAAVEALNWMVRGSLSARERVSLFLPLVNDSDPAVRQNATMALMGLGPAASNAVPALIANLQSNEAGRHTTVNERWFVRANTASVLADIGSPAAAAVPALSNLLAVGDSYQRVNAATAICKIKWSESAWASLTNMLSDPDKEARLVAAQNIWQISSNESLTLPFLLRELPSADTFGKSRIVRQLNDMGPRAGAAVPALVNELTNTDTPLLLAITNALKEIAPAAVGQ